MTRLPKLPPWTTAGLILAAVLLVLIAVPVLGSALGSDGPDGSDASATSSSREAGAPPSPRPLDGDRNPGAKDGDVRSDQQAGTPRGPLPQAGGSSLPSLVIGLGLLGAGISVLIRVGFTGERPWPGRYVRRID